MENAKSPFQRFHSASAPVAAALALALGLTALPLRAGQNPENTTSPATATEAPPVQGPSDAQVPAKLTLPAGTYILMRTSDYLSSNRDKAGELFHGELAEPLVVNGWVVARRGQTVIGRVDAAKKAGRIRGVSQLGVSLTQLILVDGQQISVQTQLRRTSGGTSHGADAEAVGTTTGLGAIIGAAANGGEGAGVGALIGAGAGLAGVLLTRGRPAIIPPESELTFELQSPVTFSTAASGVAFRPVRQSDYSSRDTAPALHHRPRFVPPGPYCPACGYPPYYGPWGWLGWGGPYAGPYFIGFDFGRYGFGRDFRR